jgi:hypothetical protein
LQILINELHNPDFGKVAVRFVADKPHRKNVAQCNRYQIGTFLNQQLQAVSKVLEGVLGIGCHCYAFAL